MQAKKEDPPRQYPFVARKYRLRHSLKGLREVLRRTLGSSSSNSSGTRHHYSRGIRRRGGRGVKKGRTVNRFMWKWSRIGIQRHLSGRELHGIRRTCLEIKLKSMRLHLQETERTLYFFFFIFWRAPFALKNYRYRSDQWCFTTQN